MNPSHRMSANGSPAATRRQSVSSPKKEVPNGEVANNKKEPGDTIIERILKAADPNSMSTPVFFDYKKEARTFKLVPTVSTVTVHLAIDGDALRKDSAEAQQQAEDRQRRQEEVERAAEAELNPELVEEGVSTKILKNQFNYSDRGSQTMNNPLKECSVVTDPPPAKTFGALATAWNIFDAYEAERIQAEREAAAQRAAAAAQRAGKEEERAAASAALSAELQAQDDDAPRTAEDILRSSGFDTALRVMERMVNQNDCHDIIDDFKFWEDLSDQYKVDGTLLPLWQFFTERTQRRAVTSIALNNRYNDFFAVGYGSYDFQKPCKGTIHCFTLKNAVPTSTGAPMPATPEVTYCTESGVMCLAFHPTDTSLLACGLYDGSVCVFDLRVRGDKQRVRPLHLSTVRTGKHVDPVWDIYWKDSAAELSFYSISTDGRITHWAVGNQGLTSKDLMTLTTGVCSSNTETMTLNQLGGMAIDYSRAHDKIIVGTREGAVMLCTSAYNGQVLTRYEGHSMPVYRVSWSPFHPDIFITCSADWTVRLWLRTETRPLLTFDLGDAVGDVAWSPYGAAVFAAVTSNGKVCVFDLSRSKDEPLCAQTVVKNAKLTHVAFSHEDPIVLVGDTRGTVLSLKLSPNLRQIARPARGEPDDAASLRQMEVDKLTHLVEVTLKDRALLSQR